MSFGNVAALPNRGKTYLKGPNRTPDTSSTTTRAIEGTVKIFKNLDYSASGGVLAPRAGGEEVTCVLVRNDSGGALLPGYLVTWKTGYEGRRVDAYARLDWTHNIAGIVDEFLPTAGVADDDYFWLVVKGPVLAKMPASQVADVAVGNPLVSLTSTTNVSTAGRVQVAAPGGTTNITNAYSQILNVFGRALSAMSSSSTNANILINLNLPF